MIGVILGYIIINWNGLKLAGEALRCSILFSFLFLLIFIIIFTPSRSDNIDHWGHLGGFLTGLWLTAIATPLIS
jgi:membrane associated rhomboid family serine protease